MYCRRCGALLGEGYNFCKVCGTGVDELGAQLNSSLGRERVNTYQNNIQGNLNNKPGSKSLVSLILGVISIVGSCVVYIFIIPVAIIGLIFGIIDKQKSSTRTVGILLNILSIVVAIVIVVVAFFLFVLFERDTYNDDDYFSDNDNYGSNETTIYDDEFYDAWNSLSNWNRYSGLRSGNL